MTKEDALTEWKSKKRRMGCVAATDWFCARVDGYVPKRLKRPDWDHVVAVNLLTCDIVDLTPHLDRGRS